MTTAAPTTTAGFASVRQGTLDGEASGASGPDFAPVLAALRASQRAGKPLPLEFRLAQLRSLQESVTRRCDEIIAAVATDLGRPRTEGLIGEVVSTIDEIKFAAANVGGWMEPESVPHPVQLTPGRSVIVKEPVGVALIIAPWNFPINLCLSPLVGAIAAGCCAVVKPSEVVPTCAALVQTIVDEALDSSCYRCVQGEVPETSALLRLQWDHIFYTGNAAVARVVLTAAAKHLTPVTLELGGKSPVIVHESANLEIAARRILHGKFFNNGQICVAPDYILCDGATKPALEAALLEQLKVMFGADPQTARSYGRIVNERHWARVAALLTEAEALQGAGGKGVKVLAGGSAKAVQSDKYIPPTILSDVPADARIMREEIFGPVLPILSVPSVDAAVDFVNSREKPLALYVYSGDEAVATDVVQRTSAGGTCINDNVVHLSNSHLPFGGVGPSGTGQYHGKHSFDAFSHQRAVMYRGTWLDLKARYPPYDDGAIEGMKKVLIGPLLPPGVAKALMLALAVGVGLKIKSKL